MTGRTLRRTALLFSAIGIIALLTLQCKKTTVSGVSDETEIESYIQHLAPAQDVFRADRFAFTGTWSIPGSGVTYYDTVLSTSRAIKVYTADTVTYPNLGPIREAIAIVTDGFTIRETRTADSTVTTDFTLSIARYGFFLKLGSDGTEYLGWVLYGYAQSPSYLGVDITALSGSITTGGAFNQSPRNPTLEALSPHYMRLEDFKTVTKGARLQLSALRSYPPMLAGVDDAGLYHRLMHQVDSTHTLDTVSILGTSSVRAYDYILLHYVTPENGLQSAPMALIPLRLR
jgi:hypothetical protein